MKKILLILLLSLILGIIYWNISILIQYNYDTLDISLSSHYKNMSFHDASIIFIFSTGFFISGFVYSYYLTKSIKKRNDERIFTDEIVSDVEEGIVVHDKDFNILLWNNYMEKLLGYKAEEVLNKNLFSLFPQFRDYGVEEKLNKALDGEFVKLKSSPYHHKDGKKSGYVQVNFGPHTSENGDITGIVVILKDVTEEMEQKKLIEMTTKELENRNKELEEFAYVSSHDLQEPLRVVSSYCQLLKKKYYKSEDLDDESKKWINYTIEATDRMKKLIKELLDFSRVGRRDKPFEKVNLNTIIKEIKGDLKILIEETNSKIILEEKLPSIYCIRFRIKQLFYNLINNSIKFRRDKESVINISFCEEKEEWLFCIKDNGIGIPSKYFDRIFGIFKRLYSREEYEGSGIGLALCKKIVEIHNGKIWVESTVNKGTSFYFTLSKSNYIN